MRKISFILCTLLLLLPALASAYTLQVKVSGGKTGVNTVTANGLTTAGSGTYYTYPANNSATVATSVLGTVASATLDGAAFTLGNKLPAQIGGTHYLAVTFAAAASYTVTASQSTGGTIFIQQTAPSLSSNLSTALTGIGGSATVVISVYPGSTSIVTGIKVNGNAATNTMTGGVTPGAVGKVTLTAAELQSSPTITATYSASYKTSAILSAPTTAAQGATVKLDGRASSTNDTAITGYAFSVTGPAAVTVTQASAATPTATFTVPAVAGTYTANLTVTTTNGSKVAAPVTITVLSSANTVNNYCSACHNGRNPDAMAGFNASSLASVYSCNNCHQVDTSSHPGMYPSNFNTSKHWTNAYNNVSTAHGQHTCATQCHFNPAGDPNLVTANFSNPQYKDATGCQVCHSGNLQGTNVNPIGVWTAASVPTSGGTFNTMTGATVRHPGKVANGVVSTFNTCLYCHVNDGKHGTPSVDFFSSPHWNNSFEYGPEFTGASAIAPYGGTATEGQINPNESWTTSEAPDGLTTCAYRCHFKPNLNPLASYTTNMRKKDTQAVNRPGKDACVACHDPHNPTTNSANTCEECHTGGKHGPTTVAFHKSSHFTNTFETLECTSCHNPHSTIAKFFTYSGAAPVAGAADQALVKKGTDCQTCHAAGSGYGIYDATGAMKVPHSYGNQYSKLGTAAKNVGSTTTGWYTGSRYVFYNSSSQYVTTYNSCSNCHSHDNTRNAEYAESTHADPGFGRWAAKNYFKYRGFSSASIKPSNSYTDGCVRCHTTTGFVKFVSYTSSVLGISKYNDLRAWGYQEAGYTVAATSAATNNTNVSGEVITCRACHYDAPGSVSGEKNVAMPENAATVRAVGAYPAFYNFSTKNTGKWFNGVQGATGTPVMYSDLKLSNVCVSCHAGRSNATNGEAMINALAATFSGFTSTGFTGSALTGHGVYQSAIVDQKVGYRYTADGRTYTEAANNHSNIGVTNPGNTGTANGPCVGCHMAEGHSLEITSFTACAACHSSDFGQANLDQAKAELASSLKVLGGLMTSTNNFTGFKMLSSATSTSTLTGQAYSLQKTAANRTTATTIARGYVWTGNQALFARVYGAFFNLQLLNGQSADAASYIHNPSYVKQLVFDSIELVKYGSLKAGTASYANISSAVSGSGVAAADASAAKAYIIGGDGNRAGSATADCTACHNSTVDPYSGNVIATQYAASGHFQNGHGPDCATCHTPVNGLAHPYASMSTPSLAKGYSATGAGAACIACHTGAYSKLFDGVAHFTNATTATFHNVSAAYVGYVGKGINVCAQCHFKFDPHGIGATTTQTFQTNADVLAAWADSDHGNRSGAAWVPGASHDWRNSGSAANFQTTIPASDCVRCHTAAGFAQFADSKYVTVATVGANDGQKFNSPLACSACHTADVSGSTTTALRTVAVSPLAFTNRSSYGKSVGVQTFYNISTVDKATALTVKARITAKFPDVGQSNICISCHSGRVSGGALVTAKTNGLSMGNSSFQNSHYMAAAGLMYAKAGFINFTSTSAAAGTSTYGKTLIPDAISTPDGLAGGLTSTHRNLGTKAMIGDSHNPTFFVAGNLDSNGPCVTCHMQGFTNAGTPRNSAKGHSLQIDQATITQVCNQCHTSEGGNDITTIDNFNTHFIEPQSEVFQAALTLAKNQLLSKYGISYNPASYPYFYDTANSNKAVTDWTRSGALTAAQALKLEGAAFNINLLSRDPAAYVHARSYARRLLYDSIDFLDDGVMNQSAGATALASGQLNADGVTLTFGKGAAAYTDGTLTTLSSGTTEAMVYLLGWSRTSGAWNTFERP
ncbi:hypothetical protein F6V30_02490 [Oryzomonas sagensis]|uniref:Uncharacterized protein n=1 Tax=Oryzomonas sagensis TaxID=2603857 RepID=A0ABQ6TR87_9BACT|nr:hypothetical protein [Oryzomonas sagensis]KAB0671467.1 hypothetical protein F6V30_02490 [Oryzomonas sagensis]